MYFVCILWKYRFFYKFFSDENKILDVPFYLQLFIFVIKQRFSITLERKKVKVVNLWCSHNMFAQVFNML